MATALPAEARRSLASRFKRVDALAAFAAQLSAKGGVTLVLPSDQNQDAALLKIMGAGGTKQAIARALKSMRVTDRSYPLQGLPENVVLEKFSVTAPLPRLEFFTTAGPKSVADASVEAGSGWGVLRLIQQGAVRRADGKEWDAIIHVNNRGTDLVLAVTIVLDQALPPLEQWPAAPR